MVSTPTPEFIPITAGNASRRRDIVISIICHRCRERLSLNCCAVGLDGVCPLEFAADQGGCRL